MNPWAAPRELTIPGKSGPIVLDPRAWYGPGDTGLGFPIVLLREDQLAQVSDGTELWSTSGARALWSGSTSS